MPRVVPVLLLVLFGCVTLTPTASAQTAPTTAELRITGAVATPLTLTVADLKKMPRKTRGAPLPPKQGPFKLVAPHEKRPARWVRMLKSLTVLRAPTP